MLTPTLLLQWDHMEWADAELWTAALALDAAHSDVRLQEILHHMHLVQHLYLQIWSEQPLVLSELSSFEKPSTLHASARRFHSGARAFLSSLSEEQLSQPVQFPWAAELSERFGAVHPATLEESILQIVLHTMHHRAQLCTRLRMLGGEPPLVDFIAWVWRGKPAPTWPVLTAA